MCLGNANTIRERCITIRYVIMTPCSGVFTLVCPSERVLTANLSTAQPLFLTIVASCKLSSLLRYRLMNVFVGVHRRRGAPRPGRGLHWSSAPWPSLEPGAMQRHSRLHARV